MRSACAVRKWQLPHACLFTPPSLGLIYTRDRQRQALRISDQRHVFRRPPTYEGTIGYMYSQGPATTAHCKQVSTRSVCIDEDLNAKHVDDECPCELRKNEVTDKLKHPRQTAYMPRKKNRNQKRAEETDPQPVSPAPRAFNRNSNP